MILREMQSYVEHPDQRERVHTTQLQDYPRAKGGGAN